MSIASNIRIVRERAADAASKCGRSADEIKLMAVSKFHSAREVLEAAAAGITLFGENRAVEAELKFAEILAERPDLRLHLIGTLQRNKVKRVLPIVSCIQSVDRIELLQEIEKRAEKPIGVLFEIHTGEESKAGFCDLGLLERALEFALASRYIKPRGFMTMAPFTDDVSMQRASFSRLYVLAERMRAAYPEADLSELSMGMTNDFEAAISEGSTLIRVGTAIFGPRV